MTSRRPAASTGEAPRPSRRELVLVLFGVEMQQELDAFNARCRGSDHSKWLGYRDPMASLWCNSSIHHFRSTTDVGVVLAGVPIRRSAWVAGAMVVICPATDRAERLLRTGVSSGTKRHVAR